MKIMISINAVLYNRGSEALITGLISILKKEYPNSQIYLTSNERNFEKNANISNIDKYIDKNIYKSDKSVIRYFLGFTRRIPGLELITGRIRHKKVLAEAANCDLIIIIGADNYDKSYGLFDNIHLLNLLLRKKTLAQMIFYNCSLEENHIDEKVIEDLNMFDKITARESITTNNLEKKLRKNKVYYCPDPAFILEAKECELPEAWEDNNMIGINLSNLITSGKYGSNKDLILNSYYSLIEYILNDTTYNIVLVPHVMNGADLSILRVIYNKYKTTNRVLLIENENLKSTELKFVISKCKFFIGARTHATIAAYSSFVPTLVLGYSIKSKGIARDLFGSENNYVINVSNLSTGKELIDGFKWLLENEMEIRNELEMIMPNYKNKVWEVTNLFQISQ